MSRLGSNKIIKVDVRIIAATNKVLIREVEEGKFRKDLYYRLSTFPISVPPMRKRQNDIILLANNFIAKFSKNMGKQITTISKASQKMLLDYDWPGNVRELRNVIERAVISTKGSKLKITDKLIPNVNGNESQNGKAPTSLAKMERNYILKVLHECNWRIEGYNGASSILDMHPNTLRNRIKKLNIERPV